MSMAQLRTLGLPPHNDTPKNWDGLAALDLILANSLRTARIFDAGGEHYSTILPWLWLYGYRNLTVGNLTFATRSTLGPIVYEHADITRTAYPDEHFDAVTCLSVIEHGVDLSHYFGEMARITAPGGLLITSTDYWETPVDTRGQSAYGVPIHIFTKPEILAALEVARQVGFEQTGELDLGVSERVVHWKDYDLRYTFAIFSLRKQPHPRHS
jgi:SAM-dependent methyltransferase